MADLEIVDPVPNEATNSYAGQAGDDNSTIPTKPNVKDTNKKGPLLDEADEKKVAKRIYRNMWESVAKAQKNRLAMWEVNEERREGNPHVRLKKQVDEDIYTVYRPHGSENAPPGLNKTDDLCSKVVANILVDPPQPECEPNSDQDDDRDRAEFSTKVLEDILSESGINGIDLVREAEDLACTYWSGFIRPWTDPFGGGWRPREIMASMAALTVDDAVLTQGVNPQTGQPSEVPQPEPYVIRYVAKDGKSLCDEPSEAAIEWVPKIKAKVYTGKNVRMFPAGTDIRSAEAVIFADFVPLGELKARYEKVAGMGDDDLRKLCGFRPEGWKSLLPKGINPEPPEQSKEKGPSDDTLALIFSTYYRSCPQYRMGASLVTSGESFVLDKDVWTMKVEREGKSHEIPMDLPIAQFRQFRDTSPTRDPLGRGIVDKVGDGDPLLGMAIGALVEYLPKALNPHVFVPIGSGLDSASMQLPRGTPIPYLGSVGVPVQEQMPQFPPEAMELYTVVKDMMESRVGGQDASALQTPNADSGRQAIQIAEKAKESLLSVKSGMDDGFVRMCRVILQLVKRDYSLPQKMKLMGAGGRRKVKEWTASELGDTSDVKIRTGTSTMMSASAKASLAQTEFQLTSPIDPKGALEQYKRATSGKISPTLGITEEPATEEIKDQIEEWKEGAPEGWTPVQAPIDPTTQQPATDPVTGAPLPPPADPQNPFERRPHHLEQDVAVKRHDELKRAMATADFAKHPPEWQQLFIAEYEAMRQAGGIQTVAEQQQAAAQQNAGKPDPQVEAQAKQQESEANRQQADQQFQQQAQQKSVELEHSAGQAEAERQHKLQIAQAQMQQQAEQAEAERQMKLQMQANEHAVKQRELDQPIEVAQAQAKEITGGILPVVQEAVASAVEQAVSHLTLMHQESSAQQQQLIQQATEPLANELVSQRRTLQHLAQAVSQPIPEKEEKPLNVTVTLPEKKSGKKTVRLKKGADGTIEGQVSEEGEETQTIKLHRDDKGELVGAVTTETKVRPSMQKVRRQKDKV